MSGEYFDHLGDALRDAVARRVHVPWYRRVRLEGHRGAAVAVACLALTGSALAAATVFRAGAPVVDVVVSTPGLNQGVAIPASVELLPLRVSDPAGGPPWGLRRFVTTRGLVCLQVGRVVGDQIGVVGRDGAFADDGMFHPLSLNYFEAGGVECSMADARRQAFFASEVSGMPASGLFVAWSPAGGCTAGQPSADLSPCPPADLRQVYFGLLGPDAVAIEQGRARTATAGPDGAYLVVLPQPASDCRRASSACDVHAFDLTAVPTAGPVTVVDYRDAPPCRPSSGKPCRLVGWAALNPRVPTSAELATRVTVTVTRVALYCATPTKARPCASYPAPGSLKPAPPPPPPGGFLAVNVHFTARIAVLGPPAGYALSVGVPSCAAGPRAADAAETEVIPLNVVRAGRRITATMLVPGRCSGESRVAVFYLPPRSHAGPVGVVVLSHGAIRVGETTARIP